MIREDLLLCCAAIDKEIKHVHQITGGCVAEDLIHYHDTTIKLLQKGREVVTLIPMILAELKSLADVVQMLAPDSEANLNNLKLARGLIEKCS